jgi:hypothetical protein
LRVDNCTAWRPMSDVMDVIPRVVHPDDVKGRAIHVAFRDLHFVCGVSCIEDIAEGKFTYRKIKRTNFHMYPEDVLGAQIQSASIMWDRVDSLFQSIRELMTNSGNARSGSFCVAWSSAHFKFFEVTHYKWHVFIVGLIETLNYAFVISCV